MIFRTAAATAARAISSCKRCEGKPPGRFAHRAIELRWSLLNRRALGGRVCEGHGDLRCEHVSLAGDSVTIIDCVEFSEGLRYVDVASDVGFLAMDLDRLDARGLSDELVGAYREASGDADLPLLIPLYKFHRALVRAKVEGLTGRDSAIAPERRAAAADAARRFVSRAPLRRSLRCLRGNLFAPARRVRRA